MLISGLDPNDLYQAGWGIILTDQEKPAVREALRPLLNRRKKENPNLYRELQYRASEFAPQFLARHGAGPGPVDPQRMPFYLLLVGSPESIPFEFQYQLNVQHAVGRLHFDRAEDYARYAENVLAFENESKPHSSKVASFVSVTHDDDQTMGLVSERLIRPLVKDLSKRFSDWLIDTRTDDQASKSALLRLLSHDASRLLFVSAHGYVLPPSHERQQDYQGALVCQDWPGPTSDVHEQHVLSAADISSEVQLAGSVVFLLSSNSAGTQQIDELPRAARSVSTPLAHPPQPFVSRLARRLLSHSNGALAVLGHVDQVHFTLTDGGDEAMEYRTFHHIIGSLLQGHSVGWSMRPMVDRYAVLATELSALLQNRQTGQEVPEDLIGHLWRGQREARNYIILGDPAVHL